MRNFEDYAQAYSSDYEFERVMVRYQRRLVLERLRAWRPKTVVEVGCGSELLYGYYLAHEEPVERWIIVEPASAFAEAARKAAFPNASVLPMLIEDAAADIKSLLNLPPDLIVCSGVLHEAPDPDALVASMVKLMGPSSRLHVDVSNAHSMHRRLAVAMGLIAKPDELSTRNKLLQHHCVFTMDTLTALLERFQLVAFDKGGFLIKPFTHAQMEQLCAAFGASSDAILDGLDALGRIHWEWASEIYIDAKLNVTNPIVSSTE